MMVSFPYFLIAFAQLTTAFLYTYTTGELTVVVSETTYLSTVIDGQTYDLSFLAPTATNTIHSATIDSADATFAAITNAITSPISSSNDEVTIDTATTFSTISGTTNTTSEASSTSTTQQVEASSAVNVTKPSVNTTVNATTTSSKAGAANVASSLVLGGLMFFACLL